MGNIDHNLYEKKVLTGGDFPLQIFETSRDVGKLISPHWHEHIEIHQIMEGEAVFQFGGRELRGKAGDVLIANSNELHAGYCEKAPYSSRILIFDVPDLSEELGKKNIVLDSVVTGDEIVYSLMDRLIEEYKKDEIGSRVLCKGLTLELLVHLCRHHMNRVLLQKADLKRKQNMERLNVVLCYIIENYSDTISNAKLADMMFLSEDRFCHLFRETIGMSPMKYVQDVRLKKAFRMLQSEKYSVTQVSSAVGFQDYNNFGRLFHKRFGCSPHQVIFDSEQKS